MKIKEPDLEGWNKYDPIEIPEKKRRLILRASSDGGVPMYYIVTILNEETGYCYTDFGTTYWSRWSRNGTHWAWLDELTVVKKS